MYAVDEDVGEGLLVVIVIHELLKFCGERFMNLVKELDDGKDGLYLLLTNDGLPLLHGLL